MPQVACGHCSRWAALLHYSFTLSSHMAFSSPSMLHMLALSLLGDWECRTWALQELPLAPSRHHLYYFRVMMDKGTYQLVLLLFKISSLSNIKYFDEHITQLLIPA
jgi:hypothetical protein